jgi:5-methylcytosine-specific restriction endonuclease McrA
MGKRTRCTICGGPMTMGPSSLPGGEAACRGCRINYVDPDAMCSLCATCARPLYVRLPSQLFCSDRCRQYWKNRSSVRRRVNATRDYAKRGRSRPAESFDPRYVFERDQWRCQACGRSTRAHRFPDARSATLDHIVPLSKGGEHTKANTRCVCFSCNCSKGNRATDDQLRLIG